MLPAAQDVGWGRWLRLDSGAFILISSAGMGSALAGQCHQRDHDMAVMALAGSEQAEGVVALAVAHPRVHEDAVALYGQRGGRGWGVEAAVRVQHRGGVRTPRQKQVVPVCSAIGSILLVVVDAATRRARFI
jgi:hypothetical protein